MKISLHIYCPTQWGQTVVVCSERNSNQPIELTCVSPDYWMVETTELGSTYAYQVRENEMTARQEPYDAHSISNVNSGMDLCIFDVWNDAKTPSYLQTFCFQNIFYSHEFQVFSEIDLINTITFRVCSLFLPSNKELILCGGADVFGNWHPTDAPRFVPTSYGEWMLSLSAELPIQKVEYKLAVVDKSNKSDIRWESGENREFDNFYTENNRVIVNLDASTLQNPFRAAGVSIPVFSLRSDDNFGVGEFPTLKKMVDWAKLTGQRIIQVLPINDTTSNHTWHDSYPYNAISIYALHPLYLGLNEFPLHDAQKNTTYRAKADELNDLPTVDYEQVMLLKTAYINDLFEEQGGEVIHQKSYQRFVEKNSDWLFPYACFCYLREQNGNHKFQEWSQFSEYKLEKLKIWVAESELVKKEIDKIYFTQYLLDKQLSEAKKYANSHGVILKGDIPIGVNPFSVDVWTDPSLFNLDTQTGAPPDDFAVLGQNWGFPTYNWEEMAKDGYLWWKKRFTKMADYFDAYRIDHILGFFRIWEIPQSAVHALLGHFSPALPLTKDEIEAYGFDFDEIEMTKASMLKSDANGFFGKDLDWAESHFLKKKADTLYLNEKFTSQQQILAYFEKDESNKQPDLKDKLLLFANEVLFIRDKRESSKFHPRITAYLSKRYAALDQRQKESFTHLYEDFFYHRHNDFWKTESMKKLPELLHSTGMMACGEDLGMIPACVPEVMNELDILSLVIERMPKTAFVSFEPLAKNPYLSVCTTSTHDMSPVRLWWKEDKAVTQRYFNEVLWKQGEAPSDCSVELCDQILKNHLNSPSMFVILPLQDWMSMDENWRKRPAEEERINVPADSNNYWCYRMQCAVDELIEKTTNEMIRCMGQDSGRM